MLQDVAQGCRESPTVALGRRIIFAKPVCDKIAGANAASIRLNGEFGAIALGVGGPLGLAVG